MHTQLRRFCPAGLLAAVAALGPLAVEAQYSEAGRYAGFHLGVSNVGTTASYGVQGEVAYNDRISIGGWVDTWSFGDDFTVLGSTTRWDVRYFALAGTGSYHFPVQSNPKLDPFVGVSLGYYVVSSEATGPGGVAFGGDGSRLFAGGHAGARYFFRKNMSGVARVGLGAAYLTLGMDFSL